MSGAAITQHLGCHLAGVCAACFGMAVFTANQHTASLDRIGNRKDQGGRRADQHVAIVPAGLLGAIRNGLGQSQTIGPKTVHLPVAGNQRPPQTRH